MIYSRLFLLNLIFALSVFSSVYAQSTDNYCQQVSTLLIVLEKNHYQPTTITNEISHKICHKYIDALDPYDLIFTSEDINEFTNFYDCLVNKEDLNYCSFLRAVFRIYMIRLKQADSVINLFAQKPLNYNIKEDFYIDFQDTLVGPLNNDILKDRWRRYIKYQMLDYIDVQNEVDSKNSFANFLEKEPEFRQKVILKEKCKIQRILGHPAGFENYLTSVFLNAITTTNDPHTMFFLPEEKDDFEISLSKKAHSFGFVLIEDEKGEIRIESLIPGGPAWKSNMLNEGDVLIEIKRSDNTIIDISCVDVYDLHTILQAKELQTIELTIKKNDGQVKTITLYKEELLIERNKISSFILNGEINIGYINLPGFYTDWEQGYALGCANDVAKEILKLKKEEIDGLILDLRNNGGGAVAEAMDLAGIFIDSGPLGVYREQEVKPRLIKDINRGTIYDGPLVILVNRLSASASEFLAAVLQDYNRAVIVGSPTYGKATGQVIIPNDTTFNIDYNNQVENINNQGYIKITNSKFYRVNGTSFQKTGVIPDVLLPDILDYYNVGESVTSYALNNDSIIKEVYYSPSSLLPISKLKQLSVLRIALDSNFKMIKSLENSFNHFISNSGKRSLYKDSLINRLGMSMILFQAIEGLYTNNSDRFIVRSNNFDKDLIEIDQNKKMIYEKVIEDISNDMYIIESFEIINDLITIKQGNEL